VMRVGDGRLEVPAASQVEGEARQNADVILKEEADVPTVVDLDHRRILLHADRKAEQVLRYDVPAAASCGRAEAEVAVVIQLSVVNHLFKNGLATERNRMPAVVDVER